MKIALVSHLPVTAHGGVEILLRELACGLGAAHDVFLASPDPTEEVMGSPVGPVLAGHHRLRMDDQGTADAASITAWLAEHRIGTCHFHSGGTYGFRAGSSRHCLIPAIARRGVRCFSTNHQTTGPLDVNRQGEPLPRRLAAYVIRVPGKTLQLRSVEREILVSDHDLAQSRRWYPHCRSKFRRIYHSRLDSGVEAPPLPESKVILNLASLATRKGQHVLAEAFARIASDFPDWTLRLVGMPLDGGCVARLQELAARPDLRGRIGMPGPTDHPWEALAEAEIYVQPSLLEGLGLSLQEAQFAGRPCIGSRVGGIPELISDGTSGLLVPPADVAALAGALARLMGNRDERERLGANARREVIRKKMTRQGMIGQYLDLYQNKPAE